MSKFLGLLRDNDRGRVYRTHALRGVGPNPYGPEAGILNNIPCENTFSIFQARLGENLYNEIFHVLVDIFHQLEMITFNILAHDGTFYPTWARYKGCTYFCDGCKQITVEDALGKVKNRISPRPRLVLPLRAGGPD